MAIWMRLYETVGYFDGYKIPDDNEASVSVDGFISVADIVDLVVAEVAK